MRWCSVGLERLKQEAGSGQSRAHPVPLGGKKDPGMLCSFEERELASDAMYPHDVTGSRDFWEHH